MKRNVVELTVALVVVAAFIFLLIEASSYGRQSRMMPMAVTGLSIALCLVWVGQSALALSRGDSAGTMAEARGELPRLALIIAIVILYILAIQYVGFFTSTVAMIPLLSGTLGYRRWAITSLTTAAFACVLYAVFRLLLSIPLPPERLLGMLVG